MLKIAVLAALAVAIVASSPVPAATAGTHRQTAVEIAYRLDRELGAVDAAQRHLLIWRLLIAQNDGELAVGDAIGERWLEWQQTLELLERRLGLRQLPVWHRPARPDEATALLAAEIPETGILQWQPSIGSADLAAAGARLVTDGERVNEAAAQYPAVLAWARSHAAEIWSQLLERLAENPELTPLFEPLFSAWLALPPAQPLSAWRNLRDRAASELAQLSARPQQFGDPLNALDDEIAALQTATVSLPGQGRWRVPLARYGLFLNRDTADELDRAILSLAEGVRRIEDGGYQALMRSLASLSYLVIMRVDLLDPQPRVNAVLTRLGQMDAWLLPEIGRIDQRMLSVYQQLRLLLRDWQSQPRTREARITAIQLHTLAALNASLELTAADLDGYLSQPFREAFEINLLICFEQGTAQAPFPAVPISYEDYLGCAGHFVSWATGDAATPELAGGSAGRFEDDHLQRELGMIPDQRINYWYGFVGSQLGVDCEPVEAPLSNPIEWALAARAFVWLADRWPAYFQASNMDAQMQDLINRGRALLQARQQLAECFRTAGNDPILILMERYRQSLDEAAAAIEQATAEFRRVQLKPGADVALDGDATQTTRYHPVERPVGPCRQQASCDMAGELEATRALYELFSGPYRLADQTGMGEISLCYANVKWVDRRAEVPSARIKAMANYFGHLSFELQGLYSGQRQPVFRLRLVGNREYEYLFGENSPAVLNNPCPRHLINTQVRAELPPRRIQLVPRRLTYMTADRKQPARVFDQQWAHGDEWRDWFVTGRDVEVLETGEDPELVERVNARLRALYSGWNREVYRQILEGGGIGLGGQTELALAIRSLDLKKRTLVAVASLLRAEQIKAAPALRATLFGHNGLFDRRIALQMQNDEVPVQMTAQLARSHLDDALYRWREQAAPAALRLARTNPLISTTLLELTALQDRY